MANHAIFGIKATDMNKIQQAIEDVLDGEETILLADGFEDAFLGIARQFNTAFAVYDKAKCIEILERDMDYDEAMEYFSYNVEGAYVGEATPAFIELAS